MDHDTGWESVGRGCVTVILGVMLLLLILGLALKRGVLMKADDITIGKVYEVMVSGLHAPVKITEFVQGSQGHRSRYRGRNLRTGREVGPFTAAKMRRELSEERVAVLLGRGKGAPPVAREQRAAGAPTPGPAPLPAVGEPCNLECAAHAPGCAGGCGHTVQHRNQCLFGEGSS
jgi:hypothetical protein